LREDCVERFKEVAKRSEELGTETIYFLEDINKDICFELNRILNEYEEPEIRMRKDIALKEKSKKFIPAEIALQNYIQNYEKPPKEGEENQKTKGTKKITNLYKSLLTLMEEIIKRGSGNRGREECKKADENLQSVIEKCKSLEGMLNPMLNLQFSRPEILKINEVMKQNLKMAEKISQNQSALDDKSSDEIRNFSMKEYVDDLLLREKEKKEAEKSVIVSVAKQSQGLTKRGTVIASAAKQSQDLAKRQEDNHKEYSIIMAVGIIIEGTLKEFRNVQLSAIRLVNNFNHKEQKLELTRKPYNKLLRKMIIEHTNMDRKGDFLSPTYYEDNEEARNKVKEFLNKKQYHT
jgi:hypothetical protein